jgi:catechol 2,3-dioxygenase-like lactoylglutathione lyase family enzyme
MLRLAHLNLAVSNREVARQFYMKWFGFDRVLAEYADGTLFVTDGTGFELAFRETATRTSQGWHFGFLAASAEQVASLADRMRAEGHRVYAVDDDGSYRGFKCHDPDGHEIEVYFEPRP